MTKMMTVTMTSMITKMTISPYLADELHRVADIDS